MSGASRNPETIASDGWEVSVTGVDHRIELGPVGLFRDGPESVYLDDAVLCTLPRLRQHEDWSHAFDVEGRPATLTVSAETLEDRVLGVPAQTRLAYGLIVDGVDLGPPGPIVGKPDRPAVGTRRDRRRRRTFAIVAFGLVGFIIGAVLPVLAGWLAFGFSLLVFLIIGLVLLIAALLDPPRGMTASEVRAGLVRFGVPLAGGFAVGAAAALGVTAGLGRSPAVGRFIEDAGRIAVAVAILGVAGLLIGEVIRRRQRGQGGDRSTRDLIAVAIGALLFGAGAVLITYRYIGPDPELIDRDDWLYLAGVALLVVGLVVIRLAGLLVREKRHPSSATRVGVDSPPHDEH
ncbi:MAG: hypothetical protein ACHQ02_02420 [Candidatus Limnocylindrales bacterium]